MFESLRRMMLFSLGAADMAADKMRQMIDDFVARGEVTVEEGRKLYDEFAARAEEQRRTATERIRNQVRDMLKELGVADRAQMAAIESRIEGLENKLEEISKALPKAAGG